MTFIQFPYMILTEQNINITDSTQYEYQIYIKIVKKSQFKQTKIFWTINN